MKYSSNSFSTYINTSIYTIHVKSVFYREVNPLAWDHIGNKHQSQFSNPENMDSKLVLLATIHKSSQTTLQGTNQTSPSSNKITLTKNQKYIHIKHPVCVHV